MSEPSAEGPRPKLFAKIAMLIMVLGIVIAGWIYTGGDIGGALKVLSEREADVLAYQAAHPWTVIAIAFVVYKLVTGVSLPGAAPMTLCYGWFFAKVYGSLAGLFVALGVISFASTSGATLAFLLSRYLFRDTLQRKFGDHLVKFNTALEREGAFYLFSLRLIPAVPFWLINLVMGLTPMRVRTYWWVSQIGMLPGTIVYVYAGTELKGLGALADGDGPGIRWQLFLAFAILGLFPLAVKKLMAKVRPSDADDGPVMKDKAT